MGIEVMRTCNGDPRHLRKGLSMMLKTRLRTSVAAIALAAGSASAFAMAPVDEHGRHYQGGSATTGSDDSGNAVRSREFADTQQLETSGRGSGLDREGSSAFQAQERVTSGDNSWTEPNAGAPDAGSTASENWTHPRSMSLDQQAAANQDLNAHEAPDAGSGYAAQADEVATSGTQDEKLLVIVPSNWNGSLPELIAALDRTTDDAAVVVVDSVAWNPDMVTEGSRFE